MLFENAVVINAPSNTDVLLLCMQDVHDDCGNGNILLEMHGDWMSITSRRAIGRQALFCL